MGSNLQPFRETRRIQAELKVLLKKRGLTYRCLAGELKLSIPTVKRALAASDISLGRLSQICDAVGVEVHELLEIARVSEKDLHSLSDEQEAHFAEHPHYLHYLRALYNGKKTPLELEKACALSKRSTHRYLKKLGEMGFLRVLPGGTIRFLITGLIGWK